MFDPTVYVALLSHPRRAGRAIAPQEDPIMGAPVHLSLHTSDRDAVDALNAAIRDEWEVVYASGNGPAEGYDRASLSRRLVEDGYLAAVVERPVRLP